MHYDLRSKSMYLRSKYVYVVNTEVAKEIEMPRAAAPVIKGLEPFEIVFGENQEGVYPLHTLRKPDGAVLSRWELNDAERDSIYNHKADVYVFQHTFFNSPMPLDVQILVPNINVEKSRQVMGLDTELNHRITSGDPSHSPAMLIKDRLTEITESPRKFSSIEEYYNTVEALKMEHSLRAPEHSEMDFDEWKVSEIMRLRSLLVRNIKSV